MKTLMKKILGNYYAQCRLYIMSLYIPFFRYRLRRDLIGKILIFKSTQKFYMKCIDDFDKLVKFRNNELETDEFDKIHDFIKDEFLNKEKLYFGLYDAERLIALQWISILGYKSIEWGFAVSKDYRKGHVSDDIRERLEKYLIKNNISFLTRVFSHNERAILYLKRRGYRNYLFKDGVYYFRKYKSC